MLGVIVDTQRMSKPLTLKQLKYCNELFRTEDRSASYRACYNAENMADSSVQSACSELHRNPLIEARLEELKENAAYVAQLDVAWVLKQYMRIATADPNALVESRVVCCRHCHGVGHAYQWKDENEWAAALAATLEYNARLQEARGKDRPAPRSLPTIDGGVGFWATKPPVDTCTECFGQGTHETVLHDSKKANSPLYAGVKPTSAGPQIILRDQAGALEYLAKYLGIDKKTLEVSGPGGGPLQSITSMTNDPLEAAKIYMAAMGGAKP